MDPGDRPKIPYWHLWTDAAGVSHQTRCALTEYELKGIGAAAPQWNDKQARSEATVVFTVQPVGWVGDWHENPAPQWIVVLSGRWWIEAMDGTRIEQGPGEAWRADPMTTPRLLRIGLNVSDVARVAQFYREALGFVVVAADSARQILALGEQQIELTVPPPPSAPYPADSTAADLWFQHFAIVVPDIATAYARVKDHGAVPITRDGPVRLPAASGGVTAYKFRDPDGHPLELIAFPDRANRPGIDHTALSVADVDRSIAFYTEVIGLSLGQRQRNVGAEQDRLDGLAGVAVDVVALSADGAPHVELLGYRAPHGRSAPVGPNDIAASRIVLEVEHRGTESLCDPDGHLVEIRRR